MNTPNTFLLIEGTDFSRPIYGSGNATIVASALRRFGGRALLVGATSEDQPLGVWTYIEINGSVHAFLPVIRMSRLERPVTRSASLDLALAVCRYRKALRKAGVRKVFTRTYSVLWALNWIGKDWKACFYYPGLGNPMIVGRRAKLTRYLAAPYEYLQSIAIERVERAYAAASSDAIQIHNRKILARGGQKLVERLPTAVDTQVYFPRDKEAIRAAMMLRKEDLILCFVGRLAQVKGIDLLLEATQIIGTRYKRSVVLLLVGDGELRAELVEKVASEGLKASVRFLGMLDRVGVAEAIGAADVCVVGSHTEGFSNAMLEQLASGRPIVSTDVSGARDVVTAGVNGFVVEGRDAGEFAAAVISASALQGVEAYSTGRVEAEFSEARLWTTIEREWLDRDA